MKRVGHLFEQVVDFHGLRAAAQSASAGRRHLPAVAIFLFDQEAELFRLQRELRDRTYQPGPYRTFVIHDPKQRTINAPPFRDRVVHHALCTAVGPVFERVAIFDSYACRKGKGSHAAVDRAQSFARRRGLFLKLDIRRFYDSVDHEVLRTQVRRLIKDPDLLWLLDTIIAHGPPDAPPGKSMAIGNLTSQHLSNLYLSPLDHVIKERLQAKEYVRYMDDLLLFGDEKTALWRWHEAIEGYARDLLRLGLKSRATLVAPVSDGVPFLGLRIWPGVRRLDARRKRRLIAQLRARWRQMGDDSDDAQACLDSMNALIASTLIADTHRLRQDLVSSMMGEEGRGRQRARTG
jgi:retron-type reverse transcriptase